MDIKEQVRYVNWELSKGLSITKVEKALKLGKDNLRKRLNKQEEIKILKQIIKYKLVNNNNGLKKLMSDDYKTTTLEIEVNLGKALDQYCYENKLTKKIVINQALINYLNIK